MRKRRARKKKTGLYPYIKAANIKRLLLGLKSLVVSKELYPSDGWVTHVQVDRNPLKREARSPLGQDMPMKPRLETWGDGPAKAVRKQWPKQA